MRRNGLVPAHFYRIWAYWPRRELPPVWCRCSPEQKLATGRRPRLAISSMEASLELPGGRMHLRKQSLPEMQDLP